MFYVDSKGNVKQFFWLGCIWPFSARVLAWCLGLFASTATKDRDCVICWIRKADREASVLGLDFATVLQRVFGSCPDGVSGLCFACSSVFRKRCLHRPGICAEAPKECFMWIPKVT